MTTFNTGNPIGTKGSSDPRDLYDNSENLDVFVNDKEKDLYPDRLGVSRKTWHGMESEFDNAQSNRSSVFDAAQDDRERQYQQVILEYGNVPLGDYEAGIEVTGYNQTIRDCAGGTCVFYRAAVGTELPYTTTGLGMPEGGAFVDVGDASLRSQLASDFGAKLVRGAKLSVGSVQMLRILDVTNLVEGDTVSVGAYIFGGMLGGGDFIWDEASTEDDDGGLVIKNNGKLTGRFKRRLNEKRVCLSFFGADDTGASDVSSVVKRAFSYCQTNKMELRVLEGTYLIDSENGLEVVGGPLKLVGQGRFVSIFKFTDKLVGAALRVAGSNHNFKGIRLDGTSRLNTGTVGFATGEDETVGNKSCVDSNFEDMYVSNFDIGLSTRYSWCNVYTNCRFNTCTKLFTIGSQTNATTFNTCSFTNSWEDSRITNAEGVLFASCNVSNFYETGVGVRIVQSSVSFENPYFENPPETLFILDGSGTIINSTLMISGGVCNPTKIDYAQSSVIHIQGMRSSQGDASEILLNTASGNIEKFTQSTEVNMTLLNPKQPSLLWEIRGDAPPELEWVEGSSPHIEMNRDFLSIRQTTPNRGFYFPHEVVSGKQYSVLFCVDAARTSSTSGSTPGVSNRTIKLPSDGRWETKVAYFVAKGDGKIRFNFTGNLDIKRIALYEGILNTSRAISDTPTPVKFSSGIPRFGAWLTGDVVWANEPTSGSPAYWQCTLGGSPGIWVAGPLLV